VPLSLETALKSLDIDGRNTGARNPGRMIATMKLIQNIKIFGAKNNMLFADNTNYVKLNETA
jgi:hypothetical protein